MGVQSPRGELGSTKRGRRPRAAPWWVGFGWIVVRTQGEIHGWRQFRSGFVSCAFSFPVATRTRMEILSLVEQEIVMLERATRPKTEGGLSGTVDVDLAKKFPALAAHLCQAAWEDGDLRQTSTLAIFTGDGCWKACLRDRELGLCLWVAAKSFAALPGVLEAALGDPGTVWRVDRQASGAQASRKRK